MTSAGVKQSAELEFGLSRLRTGATIAVIDDDPEEVFATSMVLEDAGFEARPFELKREPLEDLLQRVASSSVALVCDHRLNGRENIPFSGAELVHRANLQFHLPSVLSSTYVSRDQGTSIRKWRDGIPCLLGKDEQSPESLRSALAITIAELEGRVTRSRIAFPAVIEVVEVQQHGESPSVVAIVPAWRPSTSVEIPVDIIQRDVKISVSDLPGTWLEAEVNCHAEEERDLFFRNFSLAPDLPSDWMSA
ncbi:hypothetical protein SUDANB32_03610 [Streptomyces sp. enrichment culture]|uniref:hypothetical protein n=1 Tax=Streptomyces sp. enrichment culture TaxID=1795815 RepID=UPI003F5485F0